MARYTIGLDYGTNTVRALLVDVADGGVMGTAIFEYPHGTAGVVLDSRDPNCGGSFRGIIWLGRRRRSRRCWHRGRRKG